MASYYEKRLISLHPNEYPHYENFRNEKYRNQNSLQNYNKKMTYANLYAIFS